MFRFCLTTSVKMPYKLIYSSKSSIFCLTSLKLGIWNGTFILCVHDLNIENGILQKERNSHFFLVMDWCPLRDLPQSSRNGKAINAEVDFLQLAKNIIERDADDEWFLQQKCEESKTFHIAKKSTQSRNIWKRLIHHIEMHMKKSTKCNFLNFTQVTWSLGV